MLRPRRRRRSKTGDATAAAGLRSGREGRPRRRRSRRPCDGRRPPRLPGGPTGRSSTVTNPRGRGRAPGRRRRAGGSTDRSPGHGTAIDDWTVHQPPAEVPMAAEASARRAGQRPRLRCGSTPGSAPRRRPHGTRPRGWWHDERRAAAVDPIEEPIRGPFRSRCLDIHHDTLLISPADSCSRKRCVDRSTPSAAPCAGPRRTAGPARLDRSSRRRDPGLDGRRHRRLRPSGRGPLPARVADYCR